MIRRASRSKQKTGRVTSFLGAMLRGRQRRELRRNQTTSYEYVTVGSAVEILEDRTLLVATDRWNETATDGAGLQQGDTTTLTWTIVDDGTQIIGTSFEDEGSEISPSDLIDFMDTVYGPAGGPEVSDRLWFDIFNDAFERWEAVTGLNFEYVDYDDGVAIQPGDSTKGILGFRADIRIGGHYIDGVGGEVLAYNYFPDQGDMVIDTTESAYFSNILQLRNTIAHEIGHGLGLAHVEPVINEVLMQPLATSAFDGPQFDDILSAQRMYGDQYEGLFDGNLGNDDYLRATDLGLIGDGDTESIGTDSNDTFVASTDTDFVSIDGTSDTDFYSFSILQASSIDITLSPKGPSYFARPQDGNDANDEDVEPGDLFTSSAQSDLEFQLIDSDGTTVIYSGDQFGLGEVELARSIFLTVGTYYIKVTGTQDRAQMYQLDVFAEAGLPPEVTLEWDKSSFSENGESNTLVATLSHVSEQNVVIEIELSGQAIEDTDYFVPGGNIITILAGETEGTLEVTGILDSVLDPDETLTAEIASLSPNAAEAFDQSETTTITDHPFVTLDWVNGVFSENGGTDTLVATISSTVNTDVTVTLNFTGSAQEGVDYENLSGNTITILANQSSGSLDITGLLDNVVEGEETVIAEIVSVSADAGLVGSVSATTVISGQTYVSLSWEKESFNENGETNTLTATLDEALSQNVTVTIGFTGTAIEGSDYENPDGNTITIFAGETTGTLVVTGLIDNEFNEADETIIANIIGSSDNVDDSGAPAVTTITDEPVVSIAWEKDSFSENGESNTLIATLSSPVEDDVVLTLVISGTATEGEDYTETSEITILAGETEASFTVTGLFDDVVDHNETIVVELDSLTGALELGEQIAVTTIREGNSTALDDYVNKFDPNYEYEYHSTITGNGYKTYVLDMISQQWRDASEVDKPLWQHWVSIVVPDEVESNTAILYIDGGGNGRAAPTTTPEKAVEYALTSGMIVVHIPTIPSEPLQFADEGFTRTEDEIIAYTFDKYLEEVNTDPESAAEWPLLLPMVKSAVAGMNSAQNFANVNPFTIDDFVVTGASKRGWTTWLTAAVDSRVIGIAPMVIDVLNMDESMINHKEHFTNGITSGLIEGYSEQVGDYVVLNVMDRLDTAEGQALLKIVDPYEYRDRLTIPKYIVNAANDEFFVPNSSQFYINDLIGPTYMRYTPNVGHQFGDDGVRYYIEDIAEFFAEVDAETEFPTYSWDVSSNNQNITLTVGETAPVSVKLWRADNFTNAEFRAGYPSSASYFSSNLAAIDEDGKIFTASVNTPSSGAVAYFLEVVFEFGEDKEIAFTTEAVILYAPDPEIPEVTLFASADEMDENGGTVELTAFLEYALPFDLNVNLDFTGDATKANQIPDILGGDDYSLYENYYSSLPFIFIPAGQTFGSMTIHALNDDRFEGTETLTATIGSLNGAVAASTNNQVSVDILDDEPPIGTFLDDYVNKPDSSFGFNHVNTVNGAGYTGYILDMTSQTWRTIAEVNKPVWQHWVTIVVPDVVQSDTAVLVIDGGSSPKPMPTSVNQDLIDFAMTSGLILVHVPMIPSEPLIFTDEGFQRTEDEIIAYTFDKFLEEIDTDPESAAEWPLLLPMVKSAVAGMTAAQQFDDSMSFNIDNFMVTGGSKRGWTTWLTAAVDPRVIGIAPLVIDTLNMEENLINHKEHFSYGVTDGLVEGYSEQVHDYVDLNIFERFDTPQGQALLDVIDPYRYLERLDMPKYIVNGSQDEYFVPSSSRFYVNDLIGPTYLRYVQNAGHGLNGESIVDVAQYFAALDAGVFLPEYDWTVSNQDRRITLNTETQPVSVKLWKATNPLKAEFRLGYPDSVSYVGTNLVDVGSGTYIANVSPPATGAVAYFIEMVYNVNGTNIAFTTEAVVLYGLDEVIPEVTLVSDNEVLGEYWNVGTFTAFLNQVSTQDVIIELGYSGTATRGQLTDNDYGAWMTQIVIPAGQLSGSVQVQTIPDDFVEGDETIRVDILNVTNGIEKDGSQWAITTIDDDDLPTVSLQVNKETINEYWDIATFTATLNQVSVFDTIIDLGISGSATRGVDYGLWQTQIVIPAGQLSGQILAQSKPDTLIEANEGIQVDILNVINGIELNGFQQAVTTIIDDDQPFVTLTSDRQLIGEYWDVGAFIVTLDQVSAMDVIVDLGFSGSAIKGVDYGAWQSQIVIEAGKKEGYLLVQSIPDSVIEGRETIQVDILNVTNALEKGVQTAKIDILDKDFPQVMVTANKQKIKEYWDVVTFTATLDRVAQNDVLVDVGYSGTAIKGTDYGAWQSQIVIKAGELTGTILAQAIPDSLPEDEETIVLDILDVTNAELKSGQTSLTVLIEDDDFGATVGPNPNGPGQTLLVNAGAGNDNIQVTQKTGGVINVVMNGANLGDFGGVNSIMIKGNGGNDTIELNQNVTLDAIIYGGPGNDIIRGGSGDDLILGGTGSDILDGGFQGRDVLIGGDGADFFNDNSVTGGSSSDDGDIMIAGGTVYDNSPADLFAIHQEWASNKGANARINNLRNGTGVPKLDATTLLLNDGDLDTLYGTPGLDWLLFTNGQDSANPNGGDQTN